MMTKTMRDSNTVFWIGGCPCPPDLPSHSLCQLKMRYEASLRRRRKTRLRRSSCTAHRVKLLKMPLKTLFMLASVPLLSILHVLDFLLLPWGLGPQDRSLKCHLRILQNAALGAFRLPPIPRLLLLPFQEMQETMANRLQSPTR